MGTARSVAACICAALLVLASSACADQAEEVVQAPQMPALGLMTSLPIYWPSQSDISAAISPDAEAPWVRRLLEERYELTPLDTLAGQGAVTPSAALSAVDYLILAQPAPLPPADYVALDEWVKAGGQVLIFADPVLTQHSQFGLGDKRRPQDIAMLGPILSRWGLELRVGPDTSGEALWSSVAIPVEAPGVLAAHGSEFADCEIQAAGLVAQCQVGEGRATVIADAAILDTELADEARIEALGSMLQRTFGRD
ncbi:ABC transporter [Altererythrobacter luteolus]|uniref:ABC transporter n=1 Tax=Pontixanthobacter luteolus TaxID=295089 RepID=A0A6I4V043_9SPHN|nr:Gldg family protein [Pontixanthobacter luteolus]MXP47208.1 ABC transporter [Pontixanthobacter luteolus]